MHINARVGTVRSRIFRTPRAFSGKSRVLPTTQSAAAARRCDRFGEPCFCYAKMVRLSTRPKQKQTIKKMELIKTIRTRVGTLRSRIFRTPRAFSGKSRVLPTTQSAAAARRCDRFGEPCFCYAKMVRLSTRPKQKQTIKKMELIKTIRTRVGTLRSRIFRTPRAFSGKSRVLPTTQSAAAARRCGCFGEPCFFCCAKNDSIIHHAPNKNRPSKRWSVFVWWARVDSDHRS